MTTAPISISIRGEEQVKLAITRVRGCLDLSKPVRGHSLWGRWRAAFFASERELFQTEGAIGRHGRWPALNPAYAEWKTLHYGATTILVASRAMEASLTGPTGDSVFEQTPNRLTIGTNRLAGYHWGKRNAIDISADQERTFFRRALAAWGNDVRKEWGE